MKLSVSLHNTTDLMGGIYADSDDKPIICIDKVARILLGKLPKNIVLTASNTRFSGSTKYKVDLSRQGYFSPYEDNWAPFHIGLLKIFRRCEIKPKGETFAYVKLTIVKSKKKL